MTGSDVACFSRSGLFASCLARLPSQRLIFNKISAGCRVMNRLLTSLGAPSLFFLTGSRRLENLQSPPRCVRSPSRNMLRRSQGSVTVNLPCGTEATRHFSYFPRPCTKSEKPSVESVLLLNNRVSHG